MVTKYWARLIPDDVAKRAQVVFASDYDALAAELAVANEGWLAVDKLKLEAQNRVSGLEAALRRVRHCVSTHVGDDQLVNVLIEMIDQDLPQTETAAQRHCEG